MNRQAEVTVQDSGEWNKLFSINLVKLLSKESLLRREEASSVNPTLWQRLDEKFSLTNLHTRPLGLLTRTIHRRKNKGEEEI